MVDDLLFLRRMNGLADLFSVQFKPVPGGKVFV